MADYAPIVLFVYKRLELTIQAIESLKKNNLAKHSHLYIFSNAPTSLADETQVNAVRKYVASIDGFANVTVISAKENRGAAVAIISGISKIFEQYDRIIVVEDDLILTPNFLDYMNAALDFYAKKKVFSVSGYGLALRFDRNDKADVYYLPRNCSWGWGTWKDRWATVDWDVSDYDTFKNDKAAQKAFNYSGGDMSRMLDFQMEGKIDAYDIRFSYAQYKSGLPTVYPKISKVENNGFGPGATHTVNNPNFKVIMDDSNKTTFKFSDTLEIDPRILRQFVYHFSIPRKIKNRLRNYARAIGKRIS